MFAHLKFSIISFQGESNWSTQQINTKKYMSTIMSEVYFNCICILRQFVSYLEFMASIFIVKILIETIWNVDLEEFLKLRSKLPTPSMDNF